MAGSGGQVKHHVIVKEKKFYLDGKEISRDEMHSIRVYFNGKSTACIEADEREQTIVIHKRKPEGGYVYDAKRKVVTERLAGKVEIDFFPYELS